VKLVHGAVASKAPVAVTAPVASVAPETSAPTSLHETPTLAPAPTAVGGPCVLAGAPHTIAPKALLHAGVETAVGADRIALGMALGERDGFVLSLDPSTFVVTSSARSRADEPLRRVVPLLSAAEVRPFFETSRKRAPIEGAHPVPADPPFVVGAAGGAFVWAPSSTSATTALWPLAGEGPIDAVRAVVLPNHAGYAVAFRQGASVFLGAMKEDKSPNGELSRIGGLGPQIGAPALGVGPDHVLVAWADRTAASAAWSIRWADWRPGSEPAAPTPFTVPPGGGGTFAMAPSLAPISGGRVVMVWTEGLGKRHEVRAQALDATDRPIGSALTVSADTVNAGQGVPALTADGRGAVVFMAAPSGASASVVAVPIVCP
jgi:hypothetical protein